MGPRLGTSIPRWTSRKLLHGGAASNRAVVAAAARQRFSSSKTTDPLRILFCGSDDFSCESLRALHQAQAHDPRLIRSIDVVTRPPKRTGRGLKVLKHAPIETLARDLQLPVHLLDSFSGWDLPLVDGDQNINLIVAVSFGLFIPSRLLKNVKYGGLNLHPSLLPDLHGPAPLQWAILLGRQHTGVTLQTLDHKAFDRGLVLAQTPRPGVPVPPKATTASLAATLAPASAAMLVDGLRGGLHVPPLLSPPPPPPQQQQQQKQEEEEPHTTAAPAYHARKLTKADAALRWDALAAGAWSGADVERRFRALGPLWGRTTSVVAAPGKGRRPAARPQPQRVIMEGVEALPPEGDHRRDADGGERPPRLREIEWETDAYAEAGRPRRYTTYWAPDVDRLGAVCVMVAPRDDPAAAVPCRFVVRHMRVEGQPSRPAFEQVRFLGAHEALPLDT